MPRFFYFHVFIFGKVLFLFILTASLGYGGTETRFSGKSIDTAENPLNPRVQHVYQGEKSPGTAMVWSGLGTLAPIVLGLSLASLSDDATFPFILIAGGLTVGPSLGEFYAASPYRGWLGIGLRMAGEFAFVYVAAKSAPGNGTGHPVAILGLATYLGSTVYSLYNASAAVTRYNSARRTRAELGWSPILIPGTDGSTRTGALAYLRF